MTKASSWILRLYFAAISAITLITLMYGSIDLLSAGLKTYVFPVADVPDYLENCATAATRYPAPVDTTVAPVSEEQQRADCDARNLDAQEAYERMKATTAIYDIALICIGLPLFILHFRFVYKDWMEERIARR